MKYQLSRESVVSLHNVIDVNLKSNGLQILSSATQLLAKLQMAENQAELLVEFAEDELKNIDAFIDGAIKQLGIGAVQGAIEIINAFKRGMINEVPQTQPDAEVQVVEQTVEEAQTQE